MTYLTKLNIQQSSHFLSIYLETETVAFLPYSCTADSPTVYISYFRLWRECTTTLMEFSPGGEIWRNSFPAPKSPTFSHKPGLFSYRFNLPVPITLFRGSRAARHLRLRAAHVISGPQPALKYYPKLEFVRNFKCNEFWFQVVNQNVLDMPNNSYFAVELTFDSDAKWIKELQSELPVTKLISIQLKISLSLRLNSY